jgi:hypothetical protein
MVNSESPLPFVPQDEMLVKPHDPPLRIPTKFAHSQSIL